MKGKTTHTSLEQKQGQIVPMNMNNKKEMGSSKNKKDIKIMPYNIEFSDIGNINLENIPKLLNDEVLIDNSIAKFDITLEVDFHDNTNQNSPDIIKLLPKEPYEGNSKRLQTEFLIGGIDQCAAMVIIGYSNKEVSKIFAAHFHSQIIKKENSNEIKHVNQRLEGWLEDEYEYEIYSYNLFEDGFKEFFGELNKLKDISIKTTSRIPGANKLYFNAEDGKEWIAVKSQKSNEKEEKKVKDNKLSAVNIKPYITVCICLLVVFLGILCILAVL